MEIIAFFALLVLIFGLISRRVERSILSPAMFFALAGILLFLLGAQVVRFDITSDVVLLLGEITLSLILFSDASRIDFKALRGNAQLPSRLLALGLPLTIVLGAALAAWLLTDLTFWEAAILSVILAPTDASLGLAVVNDRRVPTRIRQALNVESGLNDGIAVPLMFFFIALAEAELTYDKGYWVKFAVEQIGFGVLMGILVGLAGAWLIRRAILSGWMNSTFQQLSLVTLALISYELAAGAGGSGFIAAFTAGLCAGVILKHSGEKLIEFAEYEGQLLNLAMFFLLGVFTAQTLSYISLPIILYVVLSLTVVRMLPVAISLIGTRLKTPTVLFMGWFGPRGLASIVMAVVFIEETTDLPGKPVILMAVLATVFISVFAHGMSAMPWISRYQKQVQALPADAPEHQEVVELPTRAG
jgi:NhaP-type Na+/H+ or K+/H+ antiporter